MSAAPVPADPRARLLEALAAGRRVSCLSLSGSARAYVLADVLRRRGGALVCVTPDDEGAELLTGELSFFLGEESGGVLHLPADEVLPWDELVVDAQTASERMGVLHQLASGGSARALVLSAKALARRVLPKRVLLELSFVVKPGDELGRDGLGKRLVDMGYRASPLVEDPGSFSMRGDILDVFPALSEAPVRLEFFGDTLETLRRFDPQTQRTEAPVTQLLLLPARELFFNEQTRSQASASIRDAAEAQHVPSSKVRERLEQVREGVAAPGMEGLLPGFFPTGLDSVFDYLADRHEDTLFWLDDPVSLERTWEDLADDARRSHHDAVRRQDLTLGPQAHFLTQAELNERLGRHPVAQGGGLTLEAFEASVRFDYESTQPLADALKSHHGEDGALAPLLDALHAWRGEALVTIVSCGSLSQVDRLRRLLAERDVPFAVHTRKADADERPPSMPPLDVLRQSAALAHLLIGELSHGFVDRRAGLALLSDEDVLGPRARRRVRRRKSTAESFAASFQDLKEGDLCVHADFGVCRYGGLVTLPVGGLHADFLLLEFHGRDKVYLPVGRMRLVSKFTGGDPSKIALDRLGTPGWEKKKQQVKEQLLKLAAELLTLYAQRKAHPGHAFSAPDRYFHQFEADFEFDETPDQQKAIDDVLADMQKKQPMDRLVCGDVGYGKTEVAMRAAFKAVLDRKQVALLVPTTLLAHQHFASFQKRFAGYPVTVDVVSSLRKPGDVKEAFAKAREGRVDVLIGTHKLLNADVSFKDLGLLIVDEEQKFGVKQKESLKRLKTHVDTLTLSATPIPRTLNLAMSGMWDLSLITTPPLDRRAIRTFVNKFDPGQIKEAILREVQRGGQVFFIHNRVQSLASMEKFLRGLLPQVSMVVGHGQMPEGQLEKVMLDFVERRAQLLLCTSIVESGIDIASANTMIVNRADQFGLAQLYQLRGRVGRSKERAYAYLLVPQGRAVTKDAQRRLEVLQTFTELGAGFNIASHDLEIRGAGSLLGKEQSGSIEAVGFDLYAQLLEEAIAEARGEPKKQAVEPELNLPVPAYLPEHYVPDVHQRLVLYKRLAQCATPDELYDVRGELIDRFGELPDEVEHLLDVMLLRQDLRALSLRALEGGPSRLVVTLGPDAALDGGRLMSLVQRSKGLYRLTPELKLVMRVEGQLKVPELLATARKALRDLATCARS